MKMAVVLWLGLALVCIAKAIEEYAEEKTEEYKANEEEEKVYAEYR